MLYPRSPFRRKQFIDCILSRAFVGSFEWRRPIQTLRLKMQDHDVNNNSANRLFFTSANNIGILCSLSTNILASYREILAN